MKQAFAVGRVIGAGLIIAAIVGQLMLSVSLWVANDLSVAFGVTNFFSFFTIDSNVFSVVVLLLGAYFAFAKKDDPHWFTVVRGTVATYMATTGIVYNLLLRGVELPQGTTLGWSNEILHVLGPIILVLDWIFAPGRTRLSWKCVWIIVSFPLVWGGYTLIRGLVAIDSRTGLGWYPYPFMNPNNSENGYASVAFYMILIAVIIGAVGVGAIALSRRSAPGTVAG